MLNQVFNRWEDSLTLPTLFVVFMLLPHMGYKFWSSESLKKTMQRYGSLESSIIITFPQHVAWSPIWASIEAPKWAGLSRCSTKGSWGVRLQTWQVFSGWLRWMCVQIPFLVYRPQQQWNWSILSSATLWRWWKRVWTFIRGCEGPYNYVVHV